MEHYKEHNDFKVGQTVYILNYYDIEETVILDIYDDFYDDEEDYKCKWAKTDRGNERLEKIYETKRQAEYSIQNEKDSYDRYVTRIY